VMLHADGQYAPESLPAMVAPLERGEADAVFGSRMLDEGAARRGGMPLYKYVGNKILTRVENVAAGTSLSEWHSGYRAYSVAALRDLPFDRNHDDFDFDTQIIVQLIEAGKRIVEIPIPTYYGDEICRVVGMRYAKDVMLATIGSRLHQLSVLYDRKFDVAGASNRHYDLKLGYPSSHTMALEAVPAGARVLDVGCGSGAFAEELVKKGCRVSGMDRYPPSPGNVFEEFFLWDERKDPFQADLRQYDYILLLDVIEHLTEPEAFLEGLRQSSSGVGHRPRVIVTTGNVVFWMLRLQSLLGNFNYGKRGILDLTHSRLYTFRTLKKVFTQCGFSVERVSPVPAPFPKALGPGLLARALLKTNQWMNALLPGLFAYQIYMEARPLATVDALLDDAIRTSQKKTEPAAQEAGAARAS
jgi:SAM-dependent methyltransferase